MSGKDSKTASESEASRRKLLSSPLGDNDRALSMLATLGSAVDSLKL